jgi:NTP pyrophosphatase (non-canonical NTP hydrolase)
VYREGEDMSQTLNDLMATAVAVRDHYSELQKVDGQKLWNVQDRMAGFVGDVGALSKLIMVKHGLRRGPDDIDDELAHELSDCLWSVMIIANELGIDLEEAFTKSMKELHIRIEKEKVNKGQYLREKPA